jgi:hypothetical protein
MLVVAATISLALGAPAAAQSNAVTVSVPLNLTRLLPDLSKVAVECFIRSGGAASPFGPNNVTGRTELNVTGGQIVTTVTVPIPVGTANPPVGMRVLFNCSLFGFSVNQQAWGPLIPATKATVNSNAAFKLWLDPELPGSAFTINVDDEFFW